MPRSTVSHRRLALLTVGACTAAGLLVASPSPARQAATPPAATGAPAETYTESLDVRELELAVALPEGLSARRRAALTAKDFLVLDDGRSSPVTRFETLATGGPGAGPWSILVYVDRVLGRRDTVARGLSALSARAEQLVHLGQVEVVVADPDPRRVLAPSGDVQQVRAALAEAAAPPPTPPRQSELGGEVDLAAVQLQGARLLATAADRDPAGPRALLLVADVDEAGASGLAPEVLAKLPAAGAAVAAYGWSVVTVALPPPPVPNTKPPERPAPVDDHERFRSEAQGASRGETFTLGGGKKAQDIDLDRALDSAFQPRAALLRQVARESGGAVLRSEEAVERSLAELAARVRLIYRAGGQPDGRLRPVEVRLLPEDEVLIGPRWRRSGVASEVSRARSTAAIADARLTGSGLALETEIGARDGSPFVRVAVGEAQAAEPGPWRLTVGVAVEDGSLTLHQEELAGGEGTWPREVGLSLPADARRAVVLVENLVTGAWGVRVFALAKMP